MPARLTVLAAVLLVPAPALANRIISASVTVAGGPTLSAGGGDNGDAPMALVWRRLADMELKPGEGSPAVVPDPADPLRATLTGDIEVRVNEGVARVKVLRLVRQTEAAGWSLAPEDVEATAKFAGYQVIPPWTPSVPARQPSEPPAENPPKKVSPPAGVIAVFAALVAASGAVVAATVARRRKRAAGQG